MVTKLHDNAPSSDVIKRIADIAGRVIRGSKDNKDLFQTGLVLAVNHCNATGDYTNTIVPLMRAAMVYGTNLQKSATAFVEQHTQVRYNQNGYAGAQIAKMTKDPASNDAFPKLWTFDKSAEAKKDKKDADASTERWDTFKRPSRDTSGDPVDVSAKIKRLIDGLQTAIDAGTARDSIGKPVTLATIQKMLREGSDSLKINVTGTAKQTDGKIVAVSPSAPSHSNVKAPRKAKAKVLPTPPTAQAA